MPWVTADRECGFASVADGNPISEEVEEHKLRLVAEVAHAAWPLG